MKVGLVTATIEDAEGMVEVTRAKERALLCLLALTPGRVVSVDRLIDGLWGEEPPRTASKTLQTYVKNLRSRIAACGAARDTLRTEPPGYVLVVDADDVDVLRFERLADEAQRAAAEAELGEAERLFAEALAIVTQPELLAFDGAELAAGRVRITERRRRAIDDLVDVRLAQGRHLDVIAPLTERLDHEPQNERAWGQLMTALYRSNRQRDALQAFNTARDRLAEEFGLEPSPALVALEQQILTQTLEQPDQLAVEVEQVPHQVELQLRVPAADEPRAAALLDRVLEPGVAIDRYADGESHRVVLPDLNTAVRIAARLRRHDDNVTITAARANDPLPAAGEATTVFGSGLGSELAGQRWTRTDQGWRPPDAHHVARLPHALEQLRNRTLVHIDRDLRQTFTPHLDDLHAGAVRTLQVSGPAGIGKSSQLVELASLAIARGQVVLYARAEADQPLSNSALADLVYQAASVLDRAEIDHHLEMYGGALAPLLPEMARFTGLASAGSPIETEAAAVDLLQRLARCAPLLLLVDDAPLLADDAVRVVRRLMTDARTAAMLCVLACRTNDPGTPLLAEELAELFSGDQAVALRPFSITETARFLEAAAQVERSPRTQQVATLVCEAARGLPLFVREIAHDLINSTDWVTTDGKWRIDRSADEMLLPRSLSELLGRRLEQLDESAQDLASIGAVFGEFSALLVATVSELSVAEVLSALDELIAQRVVEAIPGLVDHYRFSHPLLREAASSRIGPGRQSAVALAGAELMSTQKNSSTEQLGRRAELWFRALPLAATEQVEGELRAAATAASRAGDHERALVHLRRILQLSEGEGRSCEVEVLVELAEAAMYSQAEAGTRRASARRAFERACEAADAPLAARAALAFAGPFNPFGSLVAVDSDGEAIARRALDLHTDVDDTPEKRATQARLLAMLAAARSDTSGASDEFEAALELAVSCDDQHLLGQMLSLGHALRSGEPIQNRLHTDGRILEIAATENDRHLELQGWGWTAAHAFEASDTDLLEQAARRRADLAERLDDRIYRWSDVVYTGMRHTIAGRFDQAEAALWQALEIGRLPLADHANRFFGLQLLKLSEMRGAGADLLASTEEFANRLGYVTAYVSLAHLCAETGDNERAAAVVADHVPPDLDALPNTYDRLPTLALLARLAQQLGDMTLATKVRRALVPANGLICAHADAVLYGSVAHNLGRCELALGDAQTALEYLEQSHETYTRLDAHAWLCLLDVDIAQANALAGDAATAADMRSAAEATAREMGLHLVTSPAV